MQDARCRLPIPGESTPVPRQSRSIATVGDLSADVVRANAWVPIAVIAVIAAGFLLRFSAAQHLSSHVDEAASVMAAQMIAEKGIPLFPSGTLYLQGATISYLLAPAVKFGWGDYDNLLPLRLLSVLFGTASIFFMYKFGREVTRSATAGFIAALTGWVRRELDR